MKQKTVDAARGKWVGVLKHFGIDESYLKNIHGPCPTCGGVDRFRFDDKDGNGTSFCNQCGARTGMQLLMDSTGWSFQEAAAKVDEIAGPINKSEVKSKADPAIVINRVTVALRNPGAAVESYLAGRGLKLPTTGIYQARLAYWECGKNLGDYDCMVAPIVDSKGSLESHHITYLARGMKANVPSPRKILTPLNTIKGCAVRLYGSDLGHIGIAEGIETALAVSMKTPIRCWSAMNAGNLMEFRPPEGVRKVTVFGDWDESLTGQAAAYELARRLKVQGIEVSVKFPRDGLNDFADEIMLDMETVQE